MSGTTDEYLSQSAMLSFGPINAIHQHLSGLHCYANDRTSVVAAHHFCSCVDHDGNEPKLRQCIIYDSDKPDARLIGVEYVASEDLFKSLPPEEKKYWHSHKYEVESGQLVLKSKNWVPLAAEDLAEKPTMAQLQRTYGKTIHTWAIDESPHVPLGPPRLMMSFTADDQVDPSVLEARDRVEGTSAQRKKALREGYLDTSYEPVEGCDQWMHGGKGVEFEVKEVDIAQPKAGGKTVATWKGKQPFEKVLEGRGRLPLH
ncbi:hypothetical protein Rhopal_000927-T1 [Rhodotorula paludigena]|uniref:DUF1264-domain-containing protein n=1 Tax=Rhodotorula paludigena TaxID=86838 RepID=A0AAV5GF37_9BASI|nr:hypothetical protein Rhopal_000927-T1 [Rhodotorula paludigena]